MKRESAEPVELIQLRGIWLWMAVVANCFLSLVLMIAACLRETEEYWLHSGGYSLFLQDAVFWLFYPALLVCLTGMTAGMWASMKARRVDQRLGGWLFLPCALQALVLVAVLTIALWNNVYNLLMGLPLHQHGG